MQETVQRRWRKYESQRKSTQETHPSISPLYPELSDKMSSVIVAGGVTHLHLTWEVSHPRRPVGSGWEISK